LPTESLLLEPSRSHEGHSPNVWTGMPAKGYPYGSWS
jgi:hypothetical protein